MQDIHSDNINRLESLISQARRIAIVTHMKPDGDAMGSSIALYHYIGMYGGKSVKIVLNDRYPGYLGFLAEGLPASDIIVHQERPSEAETSIKDSDLVICLDFNAFHRTDKLEGALNESKADKVLIDHHLSPDKFCNLNFSYPHLTSTCEVVFRLVVAMEGYDHLTKAACECIYAGMMTDTGCFSYGPCTQEVYLIISMLMQKEINKDRIYNKVFNNYSEGRLRLMGYVLYEKMRVFPEHHAALITLSREEMARFDFNKGDTEGLVNIPLQMKGIYFSAFLREDTEKDGLIRVSLRSQGTFPCNKFAAQYYNGGGHLNASGGQHRGTLQEATTIFEEAIKTFNKP